MQIDAYVVTKERLLAPVDAREMSDDWFLDDTVRWIKITSATPEEVERALRPLELQPRIVHACANPEPPQVEVLEKVLFTAMPLWTPEVGAMSSVRFVWAQRLLLGTPCMRHKPVFTIAGSHTAHGCMAERGSTCGPYNRILTSDKMARTWIVVIRLALHAHLSRARGGWFEPL
jgi:hypothetical protein